MRASPAAGAAPRLPLQSRFAGWRDIAWRVYAEINNDRLLAVAAGVVFYGLLALFPAITALVSSYALFADAATVGKHLAFAAALMPAGAYGIVEEQIARIAQTSGGGLSSAFMIGLALAVWSANAGMKAMIDALNVIYGEDEKRSFVELNLLSLALTLGGLVFLLLAIAHGDRAAARLRLARDREFRSMGGRDAALAGDHGRDRSLSCGALPLWPEPARGEVALAQCRRRGRDAAVGRGLGTVLLVSVELRRLQRDLWFARRRPSA